MYFIKNKKYNINMKQQKTGLTSRLTTRGIMIAVLAVVMTAGIAVPIVRADQFDQQIQALQDQNNGLQSQSNDLQSQANSYQDAISKLQAQIDSIQAQLAESQAQQASLQQQIIEKQAELDQQRALLSEDVKSMYVDGQMSAIEMLATSKNLSEFVDKEEYRNAVQKKIDDTLTKITKLQSELKIQKAEIDQLVENQKAQNAQLAASRQQQADMLAYTEAQKSQFDAKIASNSSQMAELHRQQIIANSKYNIGPAGVGVNCGGGYPAKWCNISQDSVIDSWGMYNRECVSYTAFKVHMDFLTGRDSRDMPYWGGVGNANQWDDNARAAGIPVDNNPTPGSIAISNAGYYGHAMYVEAVSVVNGQQAVYVSQYNAMLDGRYSEGWRYTTGLVFLHF
jgi:surface antigen/cell division protein FtsB